MQFAPRTLRKSIAFANAAIVFVLLGFLVYLYVQFYDMLIGQVRLTATPDLLAKIETKRFEEALGRLRQRQQLPARFDRIRNPFGTNDAQ